MVRAFEQFAVTGMKVKWIPSNTTGHYDIVNNATYSRVAELWAFDDIDTYNTNGFTD